MVVTEVTGVEEVAVLASATLTKRVVATADLPVDFPTLLPEEEVGAEEVMAAAVVVEEATVIVAAQATAIVEAQVMGDVRLYRNVSKYDNVVKLTDVHYSFTSKFRRRP